VNTIYTNFRVYGILIPQIRLEKRVYDLENHGLSLSSSIFPKIQTNIDENKAKGRDVAAWQKNLDDAKVLVAKDMTAITALSSRVAALKPADYGTTTKASMAAINADLKMIAKDFNSIGKLVRKPVIFKKLAQSMTVSPLSNTSWVWFSTVTGGVSAMAPVGDKFVLTFGKDKQLNSSTDCNRLMGKYEAGTSSLSVGPLAMTMMFCDGSKEGEYAAGLSKATSYVLDGQMLTLTSASGTMMFHKKG
jgi:heat shock protein HslJ